MTATLRSLALRLPLLVGAVILAVALVTGQLVKREITGILLESAEQRLAAGAEQVSGMLGSGIPAARRRLLEIGADPRLRAALSGAPDTAAARRILSALITDPEDERVLIQLFASDGTPRGSVVRADGADSISWGTRRARARSLPDDRVEIGPLVSYGDSAAGFALSVPIRSATGRHIGWMVEVRRARGTNVDQVRDLLGVDRLLVGSHDGNVWTDLNTRVVRPPHRDTLRAVQRVTRPDSSEALGVFRPIAGAPWVVWVERSVDDALAPMRAFLSRLWWAVLGLAGIGAAAAWWIGSYTSRRIRAVASELDRTLRAEPAAGAARGISSVRDDELRTLERSFAALEQRVSSRRQLDAQMLQSQKLEAVGRLAGGIAHDFNNLLTVITNYVSLASERLPAGSDAASDLAEVRNACDRATALTRQLLAFSRQRLQDVRDLDINAVVQDTMRLVVRLIPSNVERDLQLGADVPTVRADAVQLEQILLNLIVNAADAMPEGGRLSIRTSGEMLDAIESDGVVTRAGGLHACIAVSDTGVGMDAATLARVFDPFFTTKPLGKGTGLGLATVHGIVQDAGGRVWPYSEPGRGTTMKVYLPAVAPSAAKVADRGQLPISAPDVPPGLVMVIEDDDATRSVLSRLLVQAGHRVEPLARADDALGWLRGRARDAWPMLIICDVMMPGLNGIAFARLAQEEFGGLPLILISGYTDVRDRLDDALRERVVILEKPFTASALHAALRRALPT